jgi:hypothetical protein
VVLVHNGILFFFFKVKIKEFILWRTVPLTMQSFPQFPKISSCPENKIFQTGNFHHVCDSYLEI